MSDYEAIWSVVHALREDLTHLQNRLDRACHRILTLENQAPEARQLHHEASLAAADLTESGYHNLLYEGERPVGADRHGSECQCPYCYDESQDDEPGVYDPGPECDDQGGMSEYPIVAGSEEPS